MPCLSLSTMNTIFVVDSNNTRIAFLQHHLDAAGYHTIVVDSVQHAANTLMHQQYGQSLDLILLAEESQETQQDSLLPTLLAQASSLSVAVVMLLDDAAERSTIEHYLQQGASDCLSLPIVPALLLSRVKAWIALKQAHVSEQAIAMTQTYTYEHDVQVARQIQMSMLPSVLPQPEGWQIAARFDPAREVAGDFYDAFMMTQNRRVGLVIADVCDKGVGAALFMALSRSLIRAFAQQNYSMSSQWSGMLDEDFDFSGGDGGKSKGKGKGKRHSVLSIGEASLRNAVELTHAYILDNHMDMNMFVTLFFGVLDPITGDMLYINGGHEPPLIVGPNGVKASLKKTGPAVGVFPNVTFEIHQVRLDPGDMLFCYTDGVTDARNTQREFFGKERMLNLLQQPVDSASHMLDQLMERLHSHIGDAEQFDDITMLVARREG